MPLWDMRPLAYNDWELRSWPLDAAADFVAGEPVALAASGEVQECADPVVIVATGGIIGIAAQSGDTTGAVAGGTIGNFRYTGFGDFNPSSNLPQTGDEILVYVPKRPGAEVLGKLTSDGGAIAVPTQANVGDAVGIEKGTAGNWLFSVEGTPEKLGRIVQVLDADMNPISVSGGTGVFVVVSLIVTETMSGAVTSFAVPAPIAD